MKKKSLPAIPTEFLPRGWEVIGARQFGCSSAKIKAHVYGSGTKIEVYDFMLRLAEIGKSTQPDTENNYHSLMCRLNKLLNEKENAKQENTA